MASTYLTRNSWGTPTSAKKFTISLWFKVCDTPSDESIIFNSYTGSLDRLTLSLDNNRVLKIGKSIYLEVIAIDPKANAFYHVVCKVDTTQGTDSERFKMYINGVQETSFGTSNAYSQNDTQNWQKNGENFNFMMGQELVLQLLDGLMSHVHFIDGLQLDA